MERKKEDPAGGAAAASPRPDAEPAARVADAGRLTEEEEFVMGVADVLAGAGVEGPSREVVLEVVERLVSRLHIVQREKDTATDQIRGEKPFDKGGGGGRENQRKLQVVCVKVWWLDAILFVYFDIF